MITRRGLLAGILAAGAAPAIVRDPMRIWVPRRPEEAWVVIRFSSIEPCAADLQEAYNRQMRAALDQVRLACNPPLVWVGVDRAIPDADLTAWSVVRGFRVEPLRLR